MANFYPVNTPLINYFFYKAPFIQNGFSLTNYSIQNGGTGYAVGDIIITLGGTYSTPAIFTVASVNAGVVTSVTINNSGVYITAPNMLTQSFSSGTGLGIIFDSLVFNSNLLQPPGPNIPLTGGFIYFYEDENRTVQANTYSDVSDPSNPVVNPNPITLGTSGDYPLFYMDDRLYYIVITDNTGDQSNPVQTIEHYNPSEQGVSPVAFNQNFIVNPQFNYNIEFWKLTDDIGQIVAESTIVAWAWDFLQDADTLSQNFITFENINGQQIEGSPIFQAVLNCSVASSSETLKDFRQMIGAVDFYQTQTLTFSAQMISLNGISTTCQIYLELFYGDGGSDTQLILLNTFNVGINRQKFSFSFTVPSISGKTITTGNYLALRIRPAISQICVFGMTNIMLVPGNQASPIFYDEASAFSKALILGNSTDISNAGLDQNYSAYYYSNGEIFPYADTGAIILCPTNLIQNFRLICDGSALKISDYGPNNIPYQRLYNAIGNEFGGSGDLVVTANSNVVTFSSPAGAREHSAYTAGTTSFTVANTVKGLAMGFNLVNNFDNTVTGTYVDMFAPSQTAPVWGSNIFPPMLNSGNGLLTYWGTAGNVINSGNISFSTITPGSVSTFASFLMTFHSNSPADYQSRVVTSSNIPGRTSQCSSFIEFATVVSNVRQYSAYAGNAVIAFSLDGITNNVLGQYTSPPNPPTLIQQLLFNGTLAGYGVQVNFSSRVTMAQNIQSFITQVANPFSWTVTVTTAPLASQYFLYSSATTDYYGWFTVNSIGTDPAIGGRTGVEIPILSGQTASQIATIIAETIDSAQFNVPSAAVLPVIPVGSPVSWFINL